MEAPSGQQSGFDQQDQGLSNILNGNGNFGDILKSSGVQDILNGNGVKLDDIQSLLQNLGGGSSSTSSGNDLISQIRSVVEENQGNVGDLLSSLKSTFGDTLNQEEFKNGLEIAKNLFKDSLPDVSKAIECLQNGSSDHNCFNAVDTPDSDNSDQQAMISMAFDIRVKLFFSAYVIVISCI